jgi:hypothetical protein
MSELKQMEFETETNEVGLIVKLHGSNHTATVTHWKDGTAHVACQCGASWIVAPEKASAAEIRATFNSHLSFLSRNPIKPD